MTDSLVERVKEQALNPEWHKADRVHDWRNHVSENVKALWPTFTNEQKFALVEQAEECAGNEHWD
jgi:hypothetical protein